jgi:hypothetical protein
MALGSTQPLTEKCTRNLPGGKGRPARTAENLTAICDCLENVGTSTSVNPVGLHGLLTVIGVRLPYAERQAGTAWEPSVSLPLTIFLITLSLHAFIKARP